ncbi:MAG: phosphoesterase, partial [Alphaproteobacteria bacterium]
MVLASSAVSFGSSAQADQESSGGTVGAGADRVLDSYQLRVDAAQAEASIPIPKQKTNGDEQKYRNFIGNFHKGLPHNDVGEVDPNAYRDLLNALGKGTAAALEKKVELGGDTKLVNCLAGLAFDLEGTDSHQLEIPSFPKLASQDLVDQAVELYWMALCRDVNFANYGSETLTQAAHAELFNLPAPFAGVTAQTLFRGFTAGDLIGPYVSQF